ncbi:cation diffusion facilitator family transporter [bacterium]|nr:cation diffusion facilitator family transporter [bacterium]MBU4561110.1 cation diffusion facilitator family transporter [bacterium]MCG2676440.1 cation diffusion facilitator family transporter [bacterium]MCG2678311.1 cation diffusion facilitator family transporter [bacterium]
MRNELKYKKGEKGTRIGILVLLLLALTKGIVGHWGDSRALLSDGLHSFSDVLTSVVVLIGLRIAKRPPDKTHPYGHGKAESIAAKTVAIILILIGTHFGIDNLKTIFTKTLVTPGMITLWIALIAIIVQELLFRYKFRIGKKIGSSAVIADAWHHRSDVFASLAAMIGIGGARLLGWRWLDPLAGVVVCILIMMVGIKIFLTTTGELMDATIDRRIRERIEKEALRVKGVKRVSSLRARRSGLDIFVDLEIEVDSRLTVEKGHAIAVQVEKKILREVEQVANVLVHVNPYQGL